MKLLLSLLALLGLAACSLKSASPQAAAKPLETQFADSLLKYRHLTEFLQNSADSTCVDYVLYGNLLNGNKLGIVAVTDSVLLFFQESSHQYSLKTKIHFSDYASSFRIQQLNGDNKDDLVVYGSGNMHGQQRPYVFLSDSAGVLHYRPDLSLYNIAYDASKKQLISFYEGGVNSLHSKEVRRWQGDSAKLVAGAEYDMYSGSLELYRVCNGKKNYRKLYPETRRDTALRNYHEAVYDTALFDVSKL